MVTVFSRWPLLLAATMLWHGLGPATTWFFSGLQWWYQSVTILDLYIYMLYIYIYNPTYTYHLYIMWQRVKYCAIFKHMINNVISYNNTCMQIYWKYTAISKKLTKNVSKCNSMEFHSSLKLRFSKMVEKDSWRLWLRSILWPKSWTDCTLQLPVLVDFILQKSSKIDTIYSIYPAIREIHWNPILIWGIS